MITKLKITGLFCILGSIILSCKDSGSEPQGVFDIGLLVGQWNAYESREGQKFVAQITNSLTIAYESGLSFSADGTFRIRRYNPADETWSEASTGSNGKYQLEDNRLVLTFHAGTPDAFDVYIDVIKLDTTQLWITHSHFGPKVEHHLERVQD